MKIFGEKDVLLMTELKIDTMIVKMKQQNWTLL